MTVLTKFVSRRSVAMSGRVEPIVHAERVGMVYGSGLAALENVDFALAKGEFVSLLGPSGCGKSTLLRMLAGLAHPSHGTIRRAPDARLAFVFQEPTLMPWANVERNVSLPLRLAGAARASVAAQVAEVLEMVGLKGFERAYPRELSGGMQMRVSIARALVTNPDLLLLDEPFAALDEITRAKLNSDLLNLWALKQWTVAFVTHSIYEAVYLSTRVVVMSARPGRFVEELRIPESYPRTPAFRTSGRFLEHCGQLAQALEQASEP